MNIVSQSIPAGAIDPQRMQHIQSLEQELQRQYREAGVGPQMQAPGADGMQQMAGQGRMMGPGVMQQGGLRQVPKGFYY